MTTPAELPDDLVLRPLADAGELALFTTLPYTLNHELADDLAAGRRRPEWMWVALAGGRVRARIAWWAPEAGRAPELLDILDLDDTAGDTARDRVAIGAALHRAASAAVLADVPGTPPEFMRFVPGEWRDDPVARRAVDDRVAVLEGSGARLKIERLRLEWRPGTPIPAPTGRLLFRPLRDEDELIGLMAAVVDGTLDAHTLADLASGLSPRAAAEEHFAGELARFRTPRDWWRIGTLPDGEPVGFVIPARNNYHPIIAYAGVVPAHRGHGYVDDLLAEGTRTLAAQPDIPRIRAATDLTNTPMAAAFRRAGYVTFERALHYTWA